jgi:excisionase family DNA binding protein
MANHETDNTSNEARVLGFVIREEQQRMETQSKSWSDAPNKRFLDVKEAAEYLGLAESTLYTMVSERRIPFTKMGRRTKFDRGKLDPWIHSNSVEPLLKGC